ncbi:TPA: GntR family transcriptional regulator [Pseudomonas aeruginosa]|nr:GntR family transcriptional regulator [Pseudomonas aeruginosa]HBO9716814.1 GntR family transcriptional regulator [Pseudomonas aeruginosa]HBO9722485.1 GntR family transcriptional regulator [Pseudomonas aeruginosa]HBO9781291.1 GntR family transcriptional regulator [Pseudomonas aeruginosa]HBO9812504.1 GntR family transcriptional regulator [Pseudomonas aeruginosa]
MTDQLQHIRKPPRTGKAARSGTQDEIVYAHIFDAILEQRLAPGTKLSEEALGEIFGVSRTIIRRALSRLAHEQVVLLRPNRGAVVASPSIDEARQILFARRTVERAITELATDNATAERLAELREMVVREQSSFARGDRGAGIRLSGEFHLKLAEMARNAPLVSFQRSLVSQTSLIIAQYESGGRSHCSFDEHNEILDAIEKGDKERAVTLMMHHMEHIDSKLNLESDNASGDLHAVFSHLLGGKKKPRRAKADSDSAA